MGTLFSSLDIARSGLQAAQVQMDVSGHNIANVNTEGYSRQRVDLGTPDAQARSYGYIGRGVQVQDVARLREDFLDTVYRQQVPGLGSAETRASYFSRIEGLFQEPGTNGFGNQISEFFNALSDYANNVESQPVRMSVITQAESLSSSLNQLQQQVFALRSNANEEVRNMIPDVNSLSSRIAEMNVTIRQAEAGGHKANDLRDERDTLLDQLAKTINITYRERPDGEVDVFVAGDSLVSGESARQLEAVPDPTIDPQRADLVRVQYADNGQAVDIRDGSLYGALQARDTDLVNVGSSLDRIAGSLIQEVNKIHNTGHGLDTLSGTIASTNPVTDASAPLGSAGVPFTVQPGSFDVIVYDSSGTPTTTTINVTATTTLSGLAADLNAIPGFSGSVSGGDTLQLGATGSNTFSFANDTSGVLTALGVNGLFTGHGAGTIAVNAAIKSNPRLLTSAYSTDLTNTGDNSAATALAGVQNQKVLNNSTATISDFYESMIVKIGVDSQANTRNQQVQQTFVDDFQQRRQQVSGVSIDEEVTQMLQYQRAFQASSRVITVVDAMLDSLMAIT